MTSADLTIADAARAAGTGRHLIRTKLHAGAFPNASKDEQGFWRIPEADLRAEGLNVGAEAAEVETETTTDSVAPQPRPEGDDETAQLRLEILELRARAERAEALLAAERRLSEERARTLETERATIEALYMQITGGRPTAKPPEPPRPDWQANMRAARNRDLEQRAARERAAPRSWDTVSTETTSRSENDLAGASEKTDASPTETDRRPRWRRR